MNFPEMEEFLYNLSCLIHSWGRFGLAFNSWCFRMSTLTDEDLKNTAPKNNLGVYSTYCDKSHWSRGDGVQNFWIAINEGYMDMIDEYYS